MITLWMQMSLDGYAAGPGGALDWPVVDEELHPSPARSSTDSTRKRCTK